MNNNLSANLGAVIKMKNRNMILKFVAATMLISLISACQQVPTQDDGAASTGYSRVTSDVLPNLYDKKLSLDGNYLIVTADGNFSGIWNSEPMAGTWEMQDDYFCRVLTQFFKSENTGSEDCQLWEISGDKVRGTRNKGKGSSFIYKVN
jgi:hypothetical protein